MNQPTKEMSEGEEIIKEFLEAEGYSFEQEKEISNLKNDTKSIRRADFYLKDYKVYVEFLGKWNNEEKRQEYREKRQVYNENNIRCIYLYPDNLGILGLIFKRRLKKELLKSPKLKWQLFKLNWEIFSEKFGLTGILLVILILVINEWWGKAGVSILLLLHIYTSIKSSFLSRK